MKHFTSTMLLSTILLVKAHAEGGCPQGMYPQSGQGWQTCIPMPGYSQQQSQAALPRPQKWESRWGAIVTDEPNSVIGFSAGEKSESRAKKSATADCHRKGGKNCLFHVAYANSCASLVVGDAIYNVTTDATAEIAGQLGVDRCSKDTSNCHVYFTTCSYPERVR